MAERLETAIARVIAEGKVRTYDMGGKDSTLERCEGDCGLRYLMSYDMSGRRGDTDSPWRGRQRVHARRSQSHRRAGQFLNSDEDCSFASRHHSSFDGTSFSINRRVSGIEVVTVSQTMFQSTR